MQSPRASHIAAPNRRIAAFFGLVIVVIGVLGFVPVAAVSAATLSPRATASRVSTTKVSTIKAGRCPWITAAETTTHTPIELADQVLTHMDIAEKLSMLGLHFAHGYENETLPIPALCLPALTLQDGPNGISYGATGVTQLPASIGIAASFDPALAFQYGVVEGSEAHRKGIDVVQGPNLNLARVPNAGRNFEGYGEDPYLVSQFGVADIEGIQSQGVMANAKHFTAYNQETDRLHLDEIVSERALHELYDQPFRAAVTDAHVASIMCAYGEINGVNTCEDPALYKELSSWGFTGFVRSDLRSLTNPVLAVNAGIDLMKPAQTSVLRAAIAHHALSIDRLNAAVVAVLTQMFTYGIIQHPRASSLAAVATSNAHLAFARSAAEHSMVLLKNVSSILPLAPGHAASIAVIGSDAGAAALSAGGGSSHVIAPLLVTPLAGIERTYGARSAIAYAPGGESIGVLPRLIPLATHTQVGIAGPASVVDAITPRDRVGLQTTTDIVVAPTTGIYSVSLTNAGASWLYHNNKLVLDSPGFHGPMTWDTQMYFHAGVPSRITIVWADQSALSPELGWQNDSPAIAAAVNVAKHARYAVVFVADPSQEAADRPTLELPGDENTLVSDVAAVNRHTIVVINSGGAILMPWLSKVSAVLEAWFPGEEDGIATTAVLSGAIDPSGHLPVTFPASVAQTPAANLSSFPGVDGKVFYSEGLDIGYRFIQAHHLKPLFPFGYGLSYTNFTLSNLTISPINGGYNATVSVTNTGGKEGSDAIQGYVGFPIAAGEPPLQLKAFQTVTLAPGASTRVTLSLPQRSFRCYLNNAWTTVPGSYTINVGDSSENLPLVATVGAPLTVTPTGTTGVTNASAHGDVPRR